MKLNAGYRSVLRIRSLIEKLARYSINRAHFWAGSRFFVTQLLEIVLEYVDNLIWLQLALNSWRHSIDESIKTLSQLDVLFNLFRSFADEVLSVVSGARINTAIIVCLRL